MMRAVSDDRVNMLKALVDGIAAQMTAEDMIVTMIGHVDARAAAGENWDDACKVELVALVQGFMDEIRVLKSQLRDDLSEGQHDPGKTISD